MREKTFHVYVDSHDRSLLLQSLVELKNLLLQQGRYTDCVDELNITVRRSRQSGVARATCPDQRSHLLIVTQPEQDLDHIPLSWKGLLMD